jgi:hypothetical protein
MPVILISTDTKLIDTASIEAIDIPNGLVRYVSGVTERIASAADLKKILDAKKGPEWPRQ